MEVSPVKKLVAVALMLSLFCFCCFASAETDALLQGLITEVGDGYFLMDDTRQGAVRVNLDGETTVYEGVVTGDTLAAGQYVYVRYNGVMTRSLPPQVTAEKVSCFTVSGTVADILDTGYTVEGDAVLGTVIVRTEDAFPIVGAGVPVTVYYNGVMALSYPPQVTAVYTVVPVLEGVASGVTADGFTLTADDGATYSIAVTADTGIYTLPAEGERLKVYYNGELTDDTAAVALAVVSPEAESMQDDAAEE